MRALGCVLFAILWEPVVGSTPLPSSAEIVGFEAEHLSLLKPATANEWTPPVVDANTNAGLRFAWQFAVQAPTIDGTVVARNVSQVSATLTLETTDRATEPLICRAKAATLLNMECGGGVAWQSPATRFSAKLEVTLQAETPGGMENTIATAEGWFIRGLSEHNWGGAEWIGLVNTNDTASQYRGQGNLHTLGFHYRSDVVRATLFIVGLGGYRASVNGRALDPTSIRASVTEWHNRTYYFADDVTSDLAMAAAGSGTVVVAVELFKHWYSASEPFTQFRPYGPRSLKAVIVLTHANGTSTFAIPTTHGVDSSWRHSSGSLLFDNLHGGQGVDGRLAKPLWEYPGYKAGENAWAVPEAVTGPPGQLQAHPMHHSRVLERVIPTNVSAVPGTDNRATGYLFTLPYEVAGFCTLLLPRGCPAGMSVKVRHGECVTQNNTLCPVPILGIAKDAVDEYTCRGNVRGMGAHEVGWRRLAISGNATNVQKDQPQLEAFTPSFQYSAFKYVEVSYSSIDSDLQLAPPDLSSLSCSRIGVGFDWTGDVAVTAGGSDEPSRLLEPVSSSIPLAVDRCGRVQEGQNLTVGCTGNKTIDRIIFASFGTTAGNCTAGFSEGYCLTTNSTGNANLSLPVVAKACIGLVSCVVPATVKTFAGDGHTGQPCPRIRKSLAVEIHCSGDPNYKQPGVSCSQSCYDYNILPPTPPKPRPKVATTPAERFNAVVAATRSTAIANYVMDVPTDSAAYEKRGWAGDSLATHRTLAAFFDTRAAWIKWTEDQAFTSSMLEPAGTVGMMAPCLWGFCRNDPRCRTGTTTPPNCQTKQTTELTGVAWGSILTQLSAFTAKLSGDKRYVARIAAAASRYISLLQNYANNASYKYPELLNVTSYGDHYNVGEQGWPASSYGDWCPVGDAVGMHGCTSVSALLNSVYFLLDLEAALSLLTTKGSTTKGSTTKSDDSPSEAQLVRWIAQARDSFSEAFLHRISVLPTTLSVSAPSSIPINGLAFRDPYPPNITHHGSANVRPSAQVEASSGMAAMDTALTENDVRRAALADTLAGLVMNVSTAYSAMTSGGVIDMAHLGRSLISYGRPDAVFALLSTDGPTSLFHMAESSGTLWAHPGAGDGYNGRCNSHSHIMQGGSVGEAIFGIGGIRPAFVQGAMSGPHGRKSQEEEQLLLAPVPWLPDAPRGAAAWRTTAGMASTCWDARTDLASGRWNVWVNVTIPAGVGEAVVAVMVPRSAQPSAVCAWECGFAHPPAAAFKSEWISFGSSDGYRKIRAGVPGAEVTTATTLNTTRCALIWHAGVVSHRPVATGIRDVSWNPARPGSTLLPSLVAKVGSGSYAFVAQPC